ncbi:hypothetical protein IFM89_020269 [Coptis chinensis]|uniref:Pentatricopeptide repeat-containing protein n=1 Tax=Coptis chinensis TaxID=261450 RepID=A0A835I5Q0_9MAGN|nr:hypothetical protein IFM89_020269 [Coptis chinensis]
MSTSISRLRRVFAKNTPIITATPQILTKTQTPKQEEKPTSVKSLVNKLSKQKNLTTLVENFKKCSEIRRFRSRHLVYEKTIGRLALAKQHSLVEQVLEHQKKFDDITKEGFAMRLISLYGKAGMFDHALKLFDELPELKCVRTVKTYNALLNASVASKKFDETEKLFRELSLKLSVEPDFCSYNIVIQAFIEMRKWENALSMLDEMERNGVEPNLITFNTLLNGFYRDGKFEDGERIWARMEESGIVPDIISYNVKLQGLVNVGKISEALELVEQLRNNVEKPNIFTYNVLIKWYGNNGNLDEAKSVYDNMLKSGIVPDWFTFEALIPCVCGKGEFGLALKLCEKSIGSNCHVSAGIVQVVVDGLVKESKVEEAKGLMEIAQSKNCYGSKLKMPQEIE